MAIGDALPPGCRAAKDIWKSLGRYLQSHERTFAGELRAIKVRGSKAGVLWRVSRL